MLQVDPTWLLWLFRQTWLKSAWPDVHEYVESRSESLVRIEAKTANSEPLSEFTSYDDYMRYGRD